MARESSIWRRKDRSCYYTRIDGKQYRLDPDKAKAKRMLKELKKDLGSKTKASKEAVSTVIDEVLEWVGKHRSPGTYSAYQQRAQWFLDHIGDIAMWELTPQHVLGFVNKDGWSDGTKWTNIGTLKTIFNRAVKMGLIPSNPIQHVERPSPGRREHFITPEEHKKVLSFIPDAAFRELLIVAWECGPRPQEILRVEARHVDLKHKRWVFKASESKNKKKMRAVYMSDTAQEIVKRLVEQFPDGPIFRNTEGKPWTPWAVNCRFERLKGKERLGHKLCLYLYRHSWMTRMLKAGNDPITVAVMGGHSDPSTLAKVYQHVLADTDHVQRALAKLK